MTVRGQVVVVTGGAQGIGRSVARAFAAEGALVAIADIAPMDNIVSEVENLGGDVLPVKTDVTNETQVRSLMQQVYRRFGRIDVLINDAAIVTHFHIGEPRWPRIRDMELGFFKKVLDVNLIGTFLCTKHVIPYMESLNAGHIISFGQGTVGGPPKPLPGHNDDGMGVYHVSKRAIRAFTREVAAEERDFNICALSMGPGGDSGSEGPGPERAGRAGGGGGTITEDSPAWAREAAGSRVYSGGAHFVLAAEAPIEFSGNQVAVQGGKLVIQEN